MRKEKDDFVFEPVPAKSLLAVLANLVPLRENFLPIVDVPPDTVEIEWD